MKKIKFIVLIVIVSFLFFSCSTLAKITAITAIVGNITGVIDSDSTDAIVNTAESVDKASEKFTPEQEYYIGRAVAGTILENYKLYNNPKTQLYLNKICRTLLINSDKPYLFKGYYVAILDSDEINALSTSGGHILITRGLLDVALSEDALAAVIAHEIAHIHLEHGMKAIKQSRVSEVVKSSAGTALILSSSNKSDTAKLVNLFDDSIGDVITKMTTSGYSQQQEFDADKLALSLMANAGYNPKAMREMLTVLKAKSTAKQRGFAKTHPSAEKRLKNLEKEYEKYSVEDTSEIRVSRYEKNKL